MQSCYFTCSTIPHGQIDYLSFFWPPRTFILFVMFTTGHLSGLNQKFLGDCSYDIWFVSVLWSPMKSAHQLYLHLYITDINSGSCEINKALITSLQVNNNNKDVIIPRSFIIDLDVRLCNQNTQLNYICTNSNSMF